MKKNYNELIISKISSLIPSHIKIADFLMDTLDIGREAAYRRIRNEVSFTLDEIAKLALNLNFSVDEIISGNNSTGVLLIKSFATTDGSLTSVMYNVMKDYCRFITHYDESDTIEIVVAANQLLFLFFTNNLTILRFSYYKWIRQNNEIPAKVKFSEVELPDEIVEMAEKIRQNHQNIHKLTLIFDEGIFLSLFKEIQHFYFRKLITEQDLSLLKQALADFLDFIERLSQEGKSPVGAEGLVYLSSLSIENNQMFIKHRESALSAFFISPIVPLLVTQPNVVSLHRKWLDSLKKHSVLIAASNEIYQTEFFMKQYEYLEKLGNEILK